MSLVDFPTDQVTIWENQAKEGGKAKNFKVSDEWAWFKDRVLGVMQEQAINILKNAKDDAGRLQAQQMFIASTRPEQLLDALILQGEGARASLMEISTLKEGDK